jgi:hypothetical protein
MRLRTAFSLLYIHSYGRIIPQMCEVLGNAFLSWNSTALYNNTASLYLIRTEQLNVAVKL